MRVGLQFIWLAFVGFASVTSAQEPIVLTKPGEITALPPAGTPSSYKLPDYDKDEDPRNEWSKQEFPQHGECRWLPTEWGGKAGMGAKITKAERQAIRDSNERVRAFLATAPVVSPPVGFCPMMVSAGSNDGVDLGYALESSFMIANRQASDIARAKPGGRLQVGELSHLIFRFNIIPGSGDTGADVVTRMAAKDEQGEFFATPIPSHIFQGFPVYRNSLLVIARNNRPLYRPTPLSRVLRWQLAQFDEELKRAQGSINSARREYDSYFASEAKAEQEKILAMRIERQYAKTDEQKAKVRADYEAEIKESTERLRARWEIEGKPEHPFNVAQLRKKQAQDRLSALTPAQSKSPACLVKREPSYTTQDVGVSGDSNCQFDLVEPNPDYYDRSLPRDALQLVSIDRFPSEAPKGGLPGSRYRNMWANGHMMWGLDWQKFRREVLGGK